MGELEAFLGVWVYGFGLCLVFSAGYWVYKRWFAWDRPYRGTRR